MYKLLQQLAVCWSLQEKYGKDSVMHSNATQEDPEPLNSMAGPGAVKRPSLLMQLKRPLWKRHITQKL